MRRTAQRGDEFCRARPSNLRRGRPALFDDGSSIVRMVFLNLAVRDLAAAKAFYAGLGFSFNEQFSDERTASVVVDENIVVMLLTRDRFADFVPGGAVGDPAQGPTALTALSCGSREEVDELVSRALAHGGKPWMPAQDHGFMYGASFTDPDGHVWEPMWMDQQHVVN